MNNESQVICEKNVRQMPACQTERQALYYLFKSKA